MKRIYYVIIAAVIIATGAIVGLPYWFGLQAEQSYQKLMAELAKQSGLTVSENSYDRSWFQSKATAQFTSPQLPLRFVVNHTISHGPLLVDRWLQGSINLKPVQASIRSRINFEDNNNVNPMVTALIKNIPSLETDTAIEIDGGGQITLVLPSIKRTVGTDSAIEFGGLNASINFDAAATHFSYQASVPSIIIKLPAVNSQPAKDFKISRIDFKSDLNSGIAGYLFGTTEITIDRIEVKPVSVIRGIRLSSVTKPENKNIHATVTYQVSDIEIMNKRYGPGALTLVVRNIDAATIVKFQEEMNRMQQQPMPPEQASLMMAGKSLNLVAELAKNSPEAEVTQFKLKIGEDHVTGKAKVTVDGSKGDMTENPMLLLMAVQGDAELVVPPALFKPMLAPIIIQDLRNILSSGALPEADAIILNKAVVMDTIVDQVLPMYLDSNSFTRHLVYDGNRYQVNASFQRGQLLVNGEPLQRGAALTP
jgi:uncharacterized protein YdgA (DUF945 family)